MKDIIITSQRLRKEFYIWAGCFLFAFLLNVFSIVLFQTSWVEMFSQIGYVVVISVACYLVVALVRVLISLVRRIFKK